MSAALVVDCHMHIRGDDWNPVNLRSGLDASWARQVRWFEPPRSEPSYLHASVAQAADVSGDKAVARMDEAGVDASVMMPMDHGVGLGEEGVIPIEEKNRLCAEAAKRHPGRLYTFCGVDPRRPNALEILRTEVEEWGAIGLKLYPTNGFYPDDENLVYPLYRYLAERDLPVLLHQGHSAGRHKSKYGHPIYVDSAAADFPELRFILGHSARYETWAHEAISVAIYKTNIHLDMSLWQHWISRQRTGTQNRLDARPHRSRPYPLRIRHGRNRSIPNPQTMGRPIPNAPRMGQTTRLPHPTTPDRPDPRRKHPPHLPTRRPQPPQSRIRRSAESAATLVSPPCRRLPSPPEDSSCVVAHDALQLVLRDRVETQGLGMIVER